MNINNKKILIFLMTIMLCQFQMLNLKADDHSSIDDEELPAIDPFSGGAGSSNQVSETDTQLSSNNGLLNNMRLVGIIIGENNKIAVFSAADGGAFKYEENQAITDTTTIRDIYSEVVIVEDGENNLFEVYMNNVIKPSEG
ncbi:MAG: hypothetical protein ACJZ4R_02500 [Candidatus Pelagibacter sp.]|tara:strand:- start:2378 stop:2800 length:423 start_codon:yes stop_codon:yes gene_type:complete